MTTAADASLQTQAAAGTNVPAKKGSVASQTFAPLEGFDENSVDGKEGITSEDLRLPFLAIAQKTSKAVDDTDDAYIDGLKFGMMYNTETKDIYGQGPIEFLPLRHRKRAYLPDENGRMGEQIEWGDPRCAWPTEEEKAAGKDKPEGVRVYDWVVLLLLESGPQLAVVSFKSKSFAAGQSLTTFVSMIRGAAYTGKFKISVQLDENEAGKFGKFAVAPAGKPTTEEATFAKEIYESVKDRKLAVADENDAVPEAPAQPARPASDVPF